MGYLKGLITVLFLSLTSVASYGQIDSADSDNDTDTSTQIVTLNTIVPHKRGVYKTYEEYLANSPSVDAEFTVTPLQISRTNTLIAEADVDYAGKRPKKIWGVSDGQYVYIRMMVGRYFKNHYFRLQCDGPVPYFFYVDKTVVLAPGLGLIGMAALAAGTAALPPSVQLMVAKESTNYFQTAVGATNKRVRNYLKEFPDLSAAYDQEARHDKATRAKYMTLYNQRKLKG